MDKRNNTKLLAILAVIIIVLAGIIIVFENQVKEEKKEEQEEIVIDDRISPLTNQAVIFEVLRIRHRGLLEKLLKPGNSWKEKPKFYYETTMDGLKYESKTVTYHGNVDEQLFNTWDTIFQENKVVKDVDEEQESVYITLKIIEQEKSGLFGRKTSYVEKDSLNVLYDFRTGHWSGDDYLKDYDGYGHYLGETFEIWFNIYQVDYDDDLIPYWTEVNVLGTDPMFDDSDSDPDHDGVPTDWEWKWGYDPFDWDNHVDLDPDLDGKENIEEYQMAKWFADPFAQDIYMEVDSMEAGGLLDPPHILYEESKQGIIERFAEHNIRAYIDNGWMNGPPNGGGQLTPHMEGLITQESGMMLQFYNNYFPEERRGIFIYLLLCHSGGFQHPSKNNVYDTIQMSYYSGSSNPLEQLTFFLKFGLIPTQRGKRVSLGSAILHEMAHCCSVAARSCDFDGIDNLSFGSVFLPDKEFKETWGQYHSSLNYFYVHRDLFDLSDGKNGPPYDQDDWSMMFVGHFQYNSAVVEESYNTLEDDLPGVGQTTVFSDWWVTGYDYDANLTDEFKEYIGDFSPIDPIRLNWAVYKIRDKEENPEYKDVKIYAQPNIKTTRQWVLYDEADLDENGNFKFFSFDDIIQEKVSGI